MAQERREPLAPGRDVGALAGLRARGTELVLAPVGLVVQVGAAVLVQPHAAAPAQIARKLVAERARDHRDVHGHGREHVEQHQQLLVAPARVIVAEEDRDGLRGGVERVGNGCEPPHATQTRALTNS